jgi:uncharacterized DUF497 family protein
MRFEWDEEKAETNRQIHGVSFEDAAETFLDPNAVIEFDEKHSQQEERFWLIGLSRRGLLTTVFVEKGIDYYRIISSWKSTAREKRMYEQN